MVSGGGLWWVAGTDATTATAEVIILNIDRPWARTSYFVEVRPMKE